MKYSQTSPLKRIIRRFLEIVFARSPVGRWLRKVSPFRVFYTRLVMARHDHTGLHSGLYKTYSEALADIPSSRLAGWDHDDSSNLWVDNIDPVGITTYPIFFWLEKLYLENDRLVDVGGSIGLTYYGYRRYSKIPTAATWTVVEVTKIAQQGAKIAERENAAGLTFVDAIKTIQHCDILLCAGALQYMENSIPGLLEALRNKPRYILLNKLPLGNEEDCWTLQNYGPAVSPIRLFNEKNFIAYFERCGYKVRDRWPVPDLDCLIPFYPEKYIKYFTGFLFELSESQHQ